METIEKKERVFVVRIFGFSTNSMLFYFFFLLLWFLFLF